MSIHAQIEDLRHEIAQLGIRIAECRQDISNQKGELQKWLREVVRMEKRLRELERYEQERQALDLCAAVS